MYVIILWPFKPDFLFLEQIDAQHYFTSQTFNKSTCATFNTSWPPWPSLTWPPCTLCSRPEFCLPHWWGDLSRPRALSLSSKVQPYLRHCPPPSLLAPAKTFEVFTRQGNTFAFHLTCPNGPLKYYNGRAAKVFLLRSLPRPLNHLPRRGTFSAANPSSGKRARPAGPPLPLRHDFREKVSEKEREKVDLWSSSISWPRLHPSWDSFIHDVQFLTELWLVTVRGKTTRKMTHL